MEINKANLLKALEIVKPGLANKEIIEQTTSFAFMGDRVVTYNDEISISAPVEGLDITGAVKADQLYKLLAKIKKDEIDIEIEENELRITSGRIKAGLVLEAEIKLPLEDVSGKNKWKSLPDTFNKHVNFAAASAGHDMSQAILTCVNLREDGTIEASDGNCITQCKGEKLKISTTLIRASSAKNITRLNPTKVSEGKGWIHFSDEDGVVISCRTFADDQFPETDHLLKVKGVEVTFPRTLKEILDRAVIFAKRELSTDESTNITIGNNRFKVRSDSDSGWFEEEVNIKYNEDPLEFDITPSLLSGILSETLTCTVSDKKLRFQGDDWAYVTVLRIKQ